MNESAVLEQIEMLTRCVKQLETRVEELESHEDLRDLEKAIAENNDKPLVPWEKARAILDLD
jgi:hypothetical protein